MGSRLHGNDGRRRAHPQSSARIHGPTIVIPATAGIHGGGPAMGSRLHGNDGRRRAHPQSSARIHGPTIVIPATAGIHGEAGGDGFPSARERRGRRRTHNRRRESTAPQSSFPRRRDGFPSARGSHNRHSREAGIHGGAGDGFPSARERRAAAAHPQSSARIHGPTIVIPATAGIHGGAGDGFPSARERRAAAGAPTIVGENPRPHNRHSRDGGNPRGGRRWVPVCTGTTGGGGAPTIVGENPRPHNRHSRRRESTGGAAAMGSRLRGTHNRRRESTAPQSSFPPAGIHGGAGDGFPSARERRAAMGSRLHGNDGRRRRTHNRHSREWSYARVSLSGNDGARPCGSWSCTRAGRRPSPSRSRRRCWASGLWRSRPPARRRA